MPVVGHDGRPQGGLLLSHPGAVGTHVRGLRRTLLVQGLPGRDVPGLGTGPGSQDTTRSHALVQPSYPVGQITIRDGRPAQDRWHLGLRKHLTFLRGWRGGFVGEKVTRVGHFSVALLRRETASNLGCDISPRGVEKPGEEAFLVLATRETPVNTGEPRVTPFGRIVCPLSGTPYPYHSPGGEDGIGPILPPERWLAQAQTQSTWLRADLQRPRDTQAPASTQVHPGQGRVHPGWQRQDLEGQRRPSCARRRQSPGRGAGHGHGILVPDQGPGSMGPTPPGSTRQGQPGEARPGRDHPGRRMARRLPGLGWIYPQGLVRPRAGGGSCRRLAGRMDPDSPRDALLDRPGRGIGAQRRAGGISPLPWLVRRPPGASWSLFLGRVVTGQHVLGQARLAVRVTLTGLRQPSKARNGLALGADQADLATGEQRGLRLAHGCTGWSP